MTETRQHILHTLAYFDIFHYPLLKEEILRFHGENEPLADIEEALLLLEEDGYIFRIENFYSLHDDPALVSRRKKGNELAARQMQIARRAAAILARFPYVRGLAVSGSLSKNYCTEKTDIDFFIITRSNRLWVARTLMHLYKKFTFLTGRQKWFCMNYYIDEACPEIEEKNIFTAIEIATLLPMQGKAALQRFHKANAWIRHYFPGMAAGDSTADEIKKGTLKKLIEWIFDRTWGGWLDKKLMRITEKRWAKKEERRQKNEHGFVMSMLVNTHFSKPNPSFFQQKVLELYKSKLAGLPQIDKLTAKAV
ncbi:MAG: hypothetical protein U0X40_00305 [Ferruginibacter sp.]